VSNAALDDVASAGLAVCWAAFAITWIAGAAYNNARGPAGASGTPFGSSALIGGVLTWVAVRAVPRSAVHSLIVTAPWIRLLGLAILLAATAFTLWARFALGTMWSAAPTVKQQHELRTNGPYAVTRHPIYTGIMSMILGSVLLAAIGAWLIAIPVFLVLYEIKISQEERLMQAEFPDEYPRYKQRVPQLVPGLRVPHNRGAGR
jgi:protein-S-isoprenylcysteine O-methyltransferase Ste14